MQKTMMTISPGDGRALLFMLFPFLDTSLESPGSTILPLLVLLWGRQSRLPLSPLKIGSSFRFVTSCRFAGSYC